MKVPILDYLSQLGVTLTPLRLPLPVNDPNFYRNNSVDYLKFMCE